MLPPSFMEELRARVPVSSVVGRRVKLTKAGREMVGLCPFHNEKSPSFTVVDDKEFYHCHGCGSHGDVIAFEMRAGNRSFTEAVEILAAEAGLEVPRAAPEERERERRRATLYEVMEAACALFERQLQSPAGAQVVPAGFEARRWTVLDVGEGALQDRQYFAKMHAELDAGGREHLLTYLLNFDLSQADPSSALQTEALFEQKIASLEPHVAWWLETLHLRHLGGDGLLKIDLTVVGRRRRRGFLCHGLDGRPVAEPQGGEDVIDRGLALDILAQALDPADVGSIRTGRDLFPGVEQGRLAQTVEVGRDQGEPKGCRFDRRPLGLFKYRWAVT